MSTPISGKIKTIVVVPVALTGWTLFNKKDPGNLAILIGLPPRGARDLDGNSAGKLKNLLATGGRLGLMIEIDNIGWLD